MSLQTVASRFVELCNQGKNFEVMETMYAPDIVSVEASGVEVSGKEPVIEKSRRWAAVNEIHGEKVLGPYYDTATGAADRSAGQFAVHFSFEVTPKATGRRVRLDEIGVYTVRDDKIVREQFYFEGGR
jgi:ketosteroid isomerase-like protein